MVPLAFKPIFGLLHQSGCRYVHSAPSGGLSWLKSHARGFTGHSGLLTRTVRPDEVIPLILRNHCVNATIENKGVVTRFAPSPTGYLHIGGARTALFNWLYAR